MVIDDTEDVPANHRCRDDVLLVAWSRVDISKTINDLDQEASQSRLIMVMGKTDVLTNWQSSTSDTVQRIAREGIGTDSS